MRNIELKARCADLAMAEAVCRQIGAKKAWTRRQTDTYFRVPDGRLKVRQSEGAQATLIRYHRPDAAVPRECRYELTPLDDPEQALATLDARHGIAARVAKTRTLYQLDNIRIHLDAVESLGTFIEFEAVMEPEGDDAATQERLAELLAAFAIAPDDLLAASYCDYVAAAATGTGNPAA